MLWNRLLVRQSWDVGSLTFEYCQANIVGDRYLWVRQGLFV